MHPILEKLHLQQVSRPKNFQVGDIVRVHYKITEGNKERVQVYEGTVIAINNSGAGKTFTVRRISYDVGVERIFPLYSPTIDKIEKVRSNKIRRAKLYFLREKLGKKGRLKEIKRKDAEDTIFAKANALAAQAEEAKKIEEQKAQAAEENVVAPDNTESENSLAPSAE